jgi:hypothetical protein
MKRCDEPSGRSNQHAAGLSPCLCSSTKRSSTTRRKRIVTITGTTDDAHNQQGRSRRPLGCAGVLPSSPRSCAQQAHRLRRRRAHWNSWRVNCIGRAEFRLPLLISLFPFIGLEAVILSKATSIVVVASALPFRRVHYLFCRNRHAMANHRELVGRKSLGAYAGAPPYGPND